MTTLSTRLQLLKPDDGGPGGDDTVNVTTQISDNYDKIDDALGIIDYTGVQPTVNNYVGRLCRNTADGAIYRYNGSQWLMFRDTFRRVYTPTPTVSGGGLLLGTSPIILGTWMWLAEKVIDFQFFIQFGTGTISGGAGNYEFPLPDWSNAWGAGNSIDQEQWPFAKVYTAGAPPQQYFGGLLVSNNTGPGAKVNMYLGQATANGIMSATNPALTNGANFVANGRLMLK